MADEYDRKWEFILEEYKSLRDEELNKMDKQYKIVGLGIGSIGVLLGIAFENEIYSLFLILPLIILSSMSLFDAERGSIKNVGAYVRFMEEKIIGEGLIDIKGWERWLKERDEGKGAKADQPKGPSKEERCKPYINFDCSSLTILFVFYLACVYGLIALSGEQNITFKVFDSILITYIVATIYISVGLLAYAHYNREFFER